MGEGFKSPSPNGRKTHKPCADAAFAQRAVQVSIVDKQVSIVDKQVSIVDKQVSIVDKQVSIVDKQVSIVDKKWQLGYTAPINTRTADIKDAHG